MKTVSVVILIAFVGCVSETQQPRPERVLLPDRYQSALNACKSSYSSSVTDICRDRVITKYLESIAPENTECHGGME